MKTWNGLCGQETPEIDEDCVFFLDRSTSNVQRAGFIELDWYTFVSSLFCIYGLDEGKQMRIQKTLRLIGVCHHCGTCNEQTKLDLIMYI